jgi:hypothetical protein
MNYFKKLANFRNTRTFAIILGISATIWFLIRVIPKPSRAGYPCMKAAAPLMSSFIIYLIGISASVFSYKKFKESIRASRYIISSGFLILFFLSLSLFVINDPMTSFASSLKGIDSTFPVPSNDPIGTAIGLNPGRVVWVHDNRATNRSYDPDNAGTDWWYSNNNADQEIIKEMLETSLKEYAGVETIGEAWDAIFKAYNSSHGKGDVGYTAGEKIAIKLNITNGGNTSAERMNSTPQLIHALLHELINNVGVDPEDITVGDPYRDFRAEYSGLVATYFPDVNYVDGDGGTGVSITVPSADDVLQFSAGSESGNNNVSSSRLPQHYLDASYFINMPCLKTHDEGGITLIAKNHQGSFIGANQTPKQQFAIDMHRSLPKNSRGTRNYRHTVDYMGHEDTGGKGLIYIIDGIWAGESWQGWISKFVSEPFNNDYPSSILVGQDPVALESVCFDILFEEYDQDPGKEKYPIEFKAEIADYLKQCASSDYWPDGLEYDPEGDGTVIGSLGVFEHWNNSGDRKYSRNLGTGEGIELKYINPNSTYTESFIPEVLIKVAPNPFAEFTTFKAMESLSNNAGISIYNMKGQLVNSMEFGSSKEISWDGTNVGGSSLPNGVYIYTLRDNSELRYSGKISLSR